MPGDESQTPLLEELKGLLKVKPEEIEERIEQEGHAYRRQMTAIRTSYLEAGINLKRMPSIEHVIEDDLIEERLVRALYPGTEGINGRHFFPRLYVSNKPTEETGLGMSPTFPDTSMDYEQARHNPQDLADFVEKVKTPYFSARNAPIRPDKVGTNCFVIPETRTNISGDGREFTGKWEVLAYRPPVEVTVEE